MFQKIRETKIYKVITRREWLLFLVLGIIVGSAIKIEATKRITMGYNDYLIPPGKQDFDFKQAQKDIAEEQGSIAGVPSGASCGQ